MGHRKEAWDKLLRLSLKTIFPDGVIWAEMEMLTFTTEAFTSVFWQFPK